MTDTRVSVPEALHRALADVALGGPLTSWAHLTVQGDRTRPDGWLDSRRHTLRQRLWSAGAPEPDIDAIDAAMAVAPDVPGRASRFVVARGGGLLLNELLLGDRAGHDTGGTGFVPDVAPVLAAFGTVDRGGAPTRYDGLGVRDTVRSLRAGRVGVLTLGDAGFGEQTVVALRGAPWLGEVGDLGLDDADRLALVPTRAGLLRAALQTGVEVAFAQPGGVPDDLPVAYTFR